MSALQGLDAALTIHVQEVLARILTWQDGSYRFEVEETSILDESDVALTQSTGELLLGAVGGVSDPFLSKWSRSGAI